MHSHMYLLQTILFLSHSLSFSVRIFIYLDLSQSIYQSVYLPVIYLFIYLYLSDGTSTLQAELFTIKPALTHALTTTHNFLHILTDSLSEMQTLQKPHHLDHAH